MLSGDRLRAQDLVQEALIATYVKWPKVRDGQPFAYARTALVNANRSYWRRRPWKEQAVGLVPEDGRTSLTDINEADDRTVLLKVLMRLTERERTVVVLRYFEDLSEKEVAETLGVAVGTVKSTCARALSKLGRFAELAPDHV